MNNDYEEITIKMVKPKGSDPEIILRSLGTYYKIDRVSEAIEDDPILFFIKEIERPKEIKKQEDLVKVGVEVKLSKRDRIINKLT